MFSLQKMRKFKLCKFKNFEKLSIADLSFDSVTGRAYPTYGTRRFGNSAESIRTKPLRDFPQFAGRANHRQLNLRNGRRVNKLRAANERRKRRNGFGELRPRAGVGTLSELLRRSWIRLGGPVWE